MCRPSHKKFESLPTNLTFVLGRDTRVTTSQASSTTTRVQPKYRKALRMVNTSSIFHPRATRHEGLSSTYHSRGFGTSMWVWSIEESATTTKLPFTLIWTTSRNLGVPRVCCWEWRNSNFSSNSCSKDFRILLSFSLNWVFIHLSWVCIQTKKDIEILFTMKSAANPPNNKKKKKAHKSKKYFHAKLSLQLCEESIYIYIYIF